MDRPHPPVPTWSESDRTRYPTVGPLLGGRPSSRTLSGTRLPSDRGSLGVTYGSLTIVVPEPDVLESTVRQNPGGGRLWGVPLGRMEEELESDPRAGPGDVYEEDILENVDLEEKSFRPTVLYCNF